VPAEIAEETAKVTLFKLPETKPVRMVRLPKKEAGRILDGRTWDGVPKAHIPVHA
jgi:protein gp37